MHGTCMHLYPCTIALFTTGLLYYDLWFQCKMASTDGHFLICLREYGILRHVKRIITPWQLRIGRGSLPQRLFRLMFIFKGLSLWNVKHKMRFIQSQLVAVGSVWISCKEKVIWGVLVYCSAIITNSEVFSLALFKDGGVLLVQTELRNKKIILFLHPVFNHWLIIADSRLSLKGTCYRPI